MGRHLPTALAQYELAWKFWAYAQDGKITSDDFDKGTTYEDENDPSMRIVLSDKTFESNDEFLLALENNVLIALGVAAICLNRAREEHKYKLPDPIETEVDQFVSIVYQLRNAFAHDISEPRWNIKRERYKRLYEFSHCKIDLSDIEDQARFEWSHLGGPDVIFSMYEFYRENIYAGRT